MNPVEEQLLQEAAGNSRPLLCLRTATRIDAGRWWRPVPVWLCLTADEFVILAVGRRKHLERIAVADCPATHYNNATGELVLEPAEELRLNKLKMPPSDALRILELLPSSNLTPNT